MRIGILGGTFNPIHNGHIRLGNFAYDEYRLDKVIFIPTGLSYLKEQSNMASKQLRLHMCELAIADYSYFEVSSIEIERSGPTYTYETLEQLKGIYTDSELFFITGTDTLESIITWKRPQRVMELATLLVACRDVDSTELKRLAQARIKDIGGSIKLLHMPNIDISSSEIRRKISSGEDVSSMVPESVHKCIEENNLYK